MSDKSSKNNVFSREHYGKWVALSADRSKILDYADTLSILLKRFGTEGVVYTKPLDPEKAYDF